MGPLWDPECLLFFMLLFSKKYVILKLLIKENLFFSSSGMVKAIRADCLNREINEIGRASCRERVLLIV